MSGESRSLRSRASGQEVLEHIRDDKKAISEIARVLKPSGFFLFSVPLRMDLYSEIDQIIGHKRRYEIEKRFSAKLNLRLDIPEYIDYHL